MSARFVASEVVHGLRRHLTMTLAMILTTAVALGMLGGGLLVAKMANDSQAKYDYLNEFRVYVDREISQQDPQCEKECAQIRAEIEDTSGVQSVEYLTPEQTYAEFTELFSSTDPVLVDSTSPDALGSRFTLILDDPTQAVTVAQDLSSVEGIEVIQGQDELVERVFSVLHGVRDAALAIAAVQLVATILLIANMTQIAAFTRRTALGIMRLVGAGRVYTDLPFILEAVVASLIGSALAVGGLFVAKSAYLDTVLGEAYRANLVARITNTDIAMISPVLVGAGVVISVVTAWVTLRVTVRH